MRPRTQAKIASSALNNAAISEISTILFIDLLSNHKNWWFRWTKKKSTDQSNCDVSMNPSFIFIVSAKYTEGKTLNGYLIRFAQNYYMDARIVDFLQTKWVSSTSQWNHKWNKIYPVGYLNRENIEFFIEMDQSALFEMTWCIKYSHSFGQKNKIKITHSSELLFYKLNLPF